MIPLKILTEVSPLEPVWFDALTRRTWDHDRDTFVFGFKVHIAIDSATGLPIMLTVTKAGYGENKTVAWFVRMLLKLGIQVKFLPDAGYDGYRTGS